MRRSIPSFLGVLFACGLAVPAAAQDGNLSLAFFMTVDDANVPQLEEGIRRHNSWHQRQGDPWNWQVWQAMTGAPEYVYISSGHTWTEFDTPTIDLAEDSKDWAKTGGPHTESVSTVIWEDLLEASRPPTGQPTIVQVFEFTMNPGGDEAFTYAINKYRAAVESTGSSARFVWGDIVSGPEGATHFVVVPASSFAEFDIEGPEPPEILAQAYGMTEARNILEMFGGAMTLTASRIWVLRPDLSITPN